MIERLFRTYFWVLTFVFMTCTSYFTAGMFRTLVRLFVAAPTPYVETPKVTNHAAYSKLRAQFAILNKGNLFDTKNQPVVASKEPPKKTRNQDGRVQNSLLL